MKKINALQIIVLLLLTMGILYYPSILRAQSIFGTTTRAIFFDRFDKRDIENRKEEDGKEKRGDKKNTKDEERRDERDEKKNTASSTPVVTSTPAITPDSTSSPQATPTPVIAPIETPQPTRTPTVLGTSTAATTITKIGDGGIAAALGRNPSLYQFDQSKAYGQNPYISQRLSMLVSGILLFTALLLSLIGILLVKRPPAISRLKRIAI